MARIRSIKPEFFQHEGLAELSPLHRMLFIGLWCQADREGRLEDRPKRLKLNVLPFDNCDLDAMLTDLAGPSDDGLDFIVRYVVDGRRYIWIPTFLKHQRPHFKEVLSVIPPAPTQVGAGTNLGSGEHLPSDPRSSFPSGQNPPEVEVGNEVEVGMENGGGDIGKLAGASLDLPPESPGPPEDPDPTRENVRKIWDHYLATWPRDARLTPVRRDKIKARLKDSTLDEILLALTKSQRDDTWADRPKNSGLELLLRSREKVEFFLRMPDRQSVADQKRKAKFASETWNDEEGKGAG